MKTAYAVKTTGLLAVASLALAACGDAQTDDDGTWPDSNLEILIGFGAGGTPDLLGRGIGEQLQENHGISVTSTNRTGGASTIALNEALSAEADGTTLALATSNVLLWQPLVEEGLEYTQTDGYEALAKVGESAFSLMVAADGEFETMEDFIERAEAGEELSVAVTGEGAQTDLTVQLLNEQNGWNLRSVPYTDGAGEGILAVLRGEVDAQISTTAGVQGQIDSGDVEILSILAEETEPHNPEAPTLDEFGLEIPMGTTFYIIASDEIDEQLREEMASALEEIVTSQEWQEYLEEIGLPDAVLDYEGAQEEIEDLISQYELLEP
ncbi:Bug family tripartite tricarboxylate transporter substrate binding protein [Nesterenkonia flava]|uniref:Tripartite tricarboxylate transporter substrate binding protein n=1 Tax=Nesterenkonia flava TaxID=469799 RepID=A0ABU1FSU1_9MICC|nr:tripartite tricarboxylate transporter substrate binding protein [Nesterenkonia flava]MDR5711206.1 tripartite tricarboxylate transporter substrate binding protein [Nesterenkonia flava]